MYQDVITLFNHYASSAGDTWYPTILRNVDVNIDRGAVVAKFGEQSTDNAILHVKYTIGDGEKLIGGKKYMPPKEWDKQTNDALRETVTFTSGEQFDFFYLGEWENENPIADDDYAVGSYNGFYEYMNRRYDHVFAITSVSEFSVIPHFEIGAK